MEDTDELSGLPAKVLKDAEFAQRQGRMAMARRLRRVAGILLDQEVELARLRSANPSPQTPQEPDQ